VYYPVYPVCLLTCILETLSAADGWRYYVSHHRISDRLKPETILVSTPNADWCPRLRSSDAPVHLRADGTFGQDDPVCWPRKHHPDAPHLPFIPLADPSHDSLLHTFRRGLRKDQVTFTDDLDDGLRVGALSEDFTRDLKLQVDRFIKHIQYFLSTRKEPLPRLEGLSQSLEIATSKILNLRDTVPRLRLMFGLASRFYFEAHGYLNYYSKSQPVSEAAARPTLDSNLVGVWVEDAHVCAEYHRIGVPVWYIRKPSLISAKGDKFVEFSEPRSYGMRPLWPPDCFRDDGYVRDEPVLLDGQTDTINLLKVVDAWARSKLEAGSRWAFDRTAAGSLTLNKIMCTVLGESGVVNKRMGKSHNPMVSSVPAFSSILC